MAKITSFSHTVPSFYRYDVFISHSCQDEKWVGNVLMPGLKAVGLKVCVEEHDFPPGRPRITNIEWAIDESRYTLLVMTPAWVSCEWAEFQGVLSLSRDPVGKMPRTIPLLRAPINNLPRRLASLTCVDFTNLDKSRGQWSLLFRSLGVVHDPTLSQEANFSSMLATIAETKNKDDVTNGTSLKEILSNSSRIDQQKKPDFYSWLIDLVSMI